MSEVMDKSRIIPAMSADTEALISRLRDAQEGEVVTYAELRSLLGYDVRGKWHIVTTAKNRLREDEGKHYDTIKTVGIKRLTDAEAAATMPSYVNRARTQARNGHKRARRVDVFKVPEVERTSFVARASLLHMIDAAGSAKSQKLLQAAASQGPKDTAVLAMKKSLAALMEG
jgi:tRNA(Phe) wybutosine-synthesizing methylase Tyw3